MNDLKLTNEKEEETILGEECLKGYTTIFNGVTDTIQDLETIMNRLKMYQQFAEDCYIEKVN